MLNIIKCGDLFLMNKLRIPSSPQACASAIMAASSPMFKEAISLKEELNQVA